MNENKFKIEQVVYLKTDPELLPRIVTRYSVSKKDITYELALGGSTSWHFDFEIVASKDELKTDIGFNANTQTDS